MTAANTAPPAFPAGDLCDPEGAHRQLAHWNHRRLAPQAPSADWQADLREEARMRWLEGAWIEGFRAEVTERAHAAPRDVEGFTAWFQDLAASGLGCEPFTADLMDAGAAAQVVDQVLARMGRIDILVNVAGGTRHHQWSPLEDSPDSLFRDVFALNLDYVLRVSADTARHMIARGDGGAIVNFASISALHGAPYHGPYGAAKAAISAITETMAVEWARHRIRVNAIAPGSVRTPRCAKITLRWPSG